MADDPNDAAYHKVRSRAADEIAQARSAAKEAAGLTPEKILAMVTAITARISTIEGMLQQLHGGNGIKVDLPVISYVGQPGGGANGTPKKFWVVDTGELTLVTFLIKQ